MRTLILMTLLATLLWQCGNSDAKENENTPPSDSKKQEAIAVNFHQLESATEALAIESSGVLSSQTKTQMSFKIGGIIRKIYVEEGQSVQAGQLLAQIDPLEIGAEVQKAKSGFEKAKRDLDRAEKLHADTVATLEQVQNARTALELAQSNLKIAQYNQQHAAIYAQSSGKVLRKMAEDQEMISAGKPILVIGSTAQAAIIRLGLSDRDIVKINLGDSAEVRFDAYPNEVFAARVRQIDETADPRTGTFELELALLPQQKNLKNGFVAKAKIFPSQGNKYYKIPLAALVEADRNTAHVFVPDQQKKRALRKILRIQHLGEDYFAVNPEELKGVKEVITDGATYLQNQSKIRF